MCVCFLFCNFPGGGESSFFCLIFNIQTLITGARLGGCVSWMNTTFGAADLVSCLTPSLFLKNSKEGPPIHSWASKVKSLGTSTPEPPRKKTC